MNNAGLPGFGLGGLFYMCSVVYMFFREIMRAVLGRKTQWQSNGSLYAITFATLVALYVTYLLLDKLFAYLHVGTLSGAVNATRQHFVPLLWSLFVLFVLLAVVKLYAICKSNLSISREEPVS